VCVGVCVCVCVCVWVCVCHQGRGWESHYVCVIVDHTVVGCRTGWCVQGCIELIFLLLCFFWSWLMCLHCMQETVVDILKLHSDTHWNDFTRFVTEFKASK
jgi:hypothetical protein